MPHLRKNSANDYSYRFFSVTPIEPSVNYKIIDQLIETFPMQTLEVRGQYNGDDFSSSWLSKSYYEKNKIEYMPHQLVELLPNEIYISQNKQDDSSVKFIEIAGEKYRIKGYADKYETLVHPECFRKSIPYSEMSFMTARQLSDVEKQQLYKMLKGGLQIKTIESHDVYALARNRQIPMITVVMSIFYSLSLISFGYLVQYIVRSQAKANWIMRLAGMSHRRLMLLSTIELSVFVLFSFSLAFAVHKVFWKSFFQEINQSGVKFLATTDYLFAFTVVATLGMLILLPLMIREAR